jgi:tRNA 5-methylaminomethyl-2-thiouridine biosynthesis bifunctional protein
MIAYNGEYNLSDGKNNIIMHAQVHWSDQSEPYSTLFNDVYFNSNQGLKESQYVFFDGNSLAERWITFPDRQFCIVETGFGSGLNFFNTANNFIQFTRDNPTATLQRLHFISFEQYPLTLADLNRTLQNYPQFSSLTTQLFQQYPQPLAGCHRLSFNDGKILLDLWFGDVNEQITYLNHQNNGIADACYLDGFNPSTNPTMWTISLFTKLAEQLKPSATFSTFTSAGFVRRGLIEAGFTVEKRKGYGKKREMLIGKLNPDIVATKKAILDNSAHIPSDIAIIGGGIAALCCALSLAKRGNKVTIYCADKLLGTGASGNLQGALYPLLSQQDDPLTQLFANAYLYALNFYQELNQQHPFPHQFNGLIQLAYDNNSTNKLQKINNALFPEQLVQWIDQEKTNELAGLTIDLPALYYPNAGWLSPRALIQSIQAKLTLFNNVTIHCGQQIKTISYQDELWTLTSKNQKFKHNAIIIAAGIETLKFEQCRAVPLSAARGQVSHIKTTQLTSPLKRTLCHEGYITPSLDKIHCMGATFKRHEQNINYRNSEQIENHNKLKKCITNKPWVKSIILDDQAHIGIRCTTRDHFPYIGPLTDYNLLLENYKTGKPLENKLANLPNIFLLTGLGSRGLCSAPLLGEILASIINHESLPINKQLYEKMQIPRQWISYMKKNKPLKA